MNDNYFDDIGKRLHDMEADPPKDGWEKIQPALLETSSPDKVGWLGRNWWKPLIILIPALLYLPFSEKEVNLSTRSSSLSAETSVEQGLSRDKDNPQALPETTETKPVKRIPEEQIENSAKGNKLITATTDNSVQSETHAEAHEEKNSALIQLNDTRMAASLQVNGNQLNGEDKRSTEDHAENIAMGNDTQLKEEVLFSAAMENKDTATFISSQNAAIVTRSSALNPADTLALSLPEEKKKETQKANNSWRISVAFAPQFVTNTLKPLTNDEVFVTEINQITQVKPSGYGLAIGIGKAVTPHLYIDGQISYSTIQQNIQYDYSDGTVDTLLTVEQPDKSYLVSPVYAIENREISANYNYGGVRLGATYYFWSTPRTRFNMTASFGAHYMLASKVKEKINDEWITLNNESVNKVNYSFSAGAGYNIMMGKGWELMINPMLTWYLKEVKSQDVPYSVREEALGLNFMLSKTIGSK